MEPRSNDYNKIQFFFSQCIYIKSIMKKQIEFRKFRKIVYSNINTKTARF